MELLKDKCVLLTGAGGGIGSAVAAALAGEGATLVLADFDPAAAERVADILRGQGRRASAHQVDVASWDSCARLIGEALEAHGRIDGLVQFAGVAYFAQPWEEEDGTRARRLLEVNLLGSYQLGVQVLQCMRRQGSGSIINVSSGAQSGIAACAAYCASKAGVAGLTYAWALDAAPHGIRVNALSPIGTSGMTRTTDTYLRSKGQLQGDRPFVDPIANAPVVSFLLSELSSEVNGQVLRVHGDQVQLMSHPAVTLPSLRSERWSAASIAEALGSAFPQGLAPLGICGVRAAYEPLGKTHHVPR